MLFELVQHGFAQGVRLGAQVGNIIEDIAYQMKPIQAVQHGHVKGRRGGAFLLVAPNVDVGVVGTAVGEAMNRPWVAMIGKDDGTVRREQRIEPVAGQPMWMDLGRQEGHQVDHVDHAYLQLWKMLAKNADGGQGFKRRDVAGAGKDHIGFSFAIIGGPFPFSQTRYAMY